jgi:hypothetical protein
LKPSEAAALAEVIYSEVDTPEIGDDVRNRLTARAHGLGFTSFRPVFSSLLKDPAQSLLFYLLVDANEQGTTRTYLLRIGLASGAPAVQFRDAILIGRMRPAGEREVVVHAISFGSDEAENVMKFAEDVDRSFLPAVASDGAPRIEITEPERELPAAFERLKSQGAAASHPVFQLRGDVPPDQFQTIAVWSAIRAGWRLGYMLASEFAA